MNPYESQSPQGETPQDSDSFTPKTELLLPEYATTEQLLPSADKNRRGFLIKVGAAVASVVVLGGAFGLSKAGGHENTPTPNETVATSTPNSSPSPSSSETTNNSEHAKLVEANRIPSGLSNEEYAKTLIQRLEAWNNLGANNNTLKQSDAESIDNISKGGPGIQTIDFAQTYAKDHASEFGEALFADPSSSSADISAIAKVNGNILYDYLSTVENKVNGAQEGYKLTLTCNSVREVSPGVLEISYTVSDNSDKMGGLVHNIGIGEAKMQVAVENTDGNALIKDWKDLSVNG